MLPTRRILAARPGPKLSPYHAFSVKFKRVALPAFEWQIMENGQKRDMLKFMRLSSISVCLLLAAAAGWSGCGVRSAAESSVTPKNSTAMKDSPKPSAEELRKK